MDRITVNEIMLFPVNDCEGQLDKSGGVTPCPSTPDKYDIIGFTKLKVTAVYEGDDPAAVGTAGANGVCAPAISAFTTGQTWSLSSSYNTGGGCPPEHAGHGGGLVGAHPSEEGRRVHAVCAR